MVDFTDPASPSGVSTGAYGWVEIQSPDKPPVTQEHPGKTGELDPVRGTGKGDGNVG